jgi:hypothetical protein
MTEAIDTKPAITKTLRDKVWMARWSIMLWLLFTTTISLASWQLFPGALFWVDGGLQGIKLVVTVDLVLGPLLFIMVANPAKTQRARRVDSITLLTVQLLAMSWGGWQVYSQRPVAISVLPDAFATPLIADDFARQQLKPEALPSSQLYGMPAFYVQIPKGANAFAVLKELVERNVAIAAQAPLLRPLFEHEAEIYAKAERIQHYWTRDGAADWKAWTSRHGNKPPTAFRFIPLMGRYGNAMLILDQNNQLVGHIRLPGEKLPPAVR